MARRLKPAHIAGIIAGSLVLAGGASVGITAAVVVENNSNNAALPSIAQMQQFYNDIGCNTAYQTRSVAGENGNHYFFMKNSQTRLSVPSQPIQLNICVDDLTDKQKEVFNVGIDEINTIFSVINPAYRFEINFEPTDESLDAKSNIDITLLSEEKINALGETSKESRGIWGGCVYRYDMKSKSVTTYDSIIELNPQILTYAENGNITYGASTIQREIMHHLGLGDAYKIPDQVNCATIMNGLPSDHITKNDVALLAGKYGDYSTEEKKSALIKYVNEYEDSQIWSPSSPVNIENHKENKQEMLSFFEEKGIPAEDISFNLEECYAYFVKASMPSLKRYNSSYRLTSLHEGSFDWKSYEFTQNATEDIFDKKQGSSYGGGKINYVNGITTHEGLYYVKVRDMLYEMSKDSSGKWNANYCGNVISKHQFSVYKIRLDEVLENGSPSELEKVYRFIRDDMASQEEVE